MSPYFLLAVIGIYFSVLFVISYFTSRKAISSDFFSAGKKAPWLLVAFGMIGTSLSGVTFISVPGKVGINGFSYLQLALGYLPGYWFIALVLLPLYYRLNLISIYTWLESRFGFWSYKTGAFYFLLSRSIGSAARFYLVISVLYFAVFEPLGMPFWLVSLLALMLIWVYTYKGGLKTILYTDTLQTALMLLSLLISFWLIAQSLHTSPWGLAKLVSQSEYSKVFFWDINTKDFFGKQFLAGIFIAIVMTGLDQDMMQKNLSCKTLKESQKNMFWFSLTLLLVNVLFLFLGAALYMYAQSYHIGLPARPDRLFPLLALEHFSPFAGLVFILGIIAATYASTDAALTALTTSFCFDFMNFSTRPEANRNKLKTPIHAGFALLLWVIVLVIESVNNQSLIDAIFTAAGYTYGPLLGLYAFGLATKFGLHDRFVPIVCLAAPLLTYILNHYSAIWFGGYKFGFELLIVNGIITFIGLLLIRKPADIILVD